MVDITIQQTIPNVASNAINTCPDAFVELNDYVLDAIPSNAVLQWFQSNEDGIFIPIEESLVTSSGTFKARYFFPNENCFGFLSDAIDVNVDKCCDAQPILYFINEDTTIDKPRAYDGSILVKTGATLTITSYVEFAENKKIIIENGATLILSGPSATLNDCPDALRWEGIEVLDGGKLIIEEGYIYAAYYAIHAKSGSSINIRNLVAFGTGNYDNAKCAVFLDGSVDLINLEKVKIENYHTGINCENSLNYYNFSEGSISNVFNGIKLVNAPARINEFSISMQNDAINAYQSPGLLIENNFLTTTFGNDYSDSDGISMWWCDGSVIQNNVIGTASNAPSTGISLYLSNAGSIRNMNIIQGKRTGIFAFNTDFSIIQNDLSVTSDNSLNRGALSLMFGNKNQILNNFINAQNVAFGINTRLSANTQIENNDISTSFDPIYTRAAGIKSEGCNAEVIKNNLINGLGNTDGIIATATTGNTFDCNYIDVVDNNEALNILYNSQGQSVRGNRLTANGNDLLVRSIIGEQLHEGNEFKGGNTFAENDLIAGDSRFYVNSTYSFHMPVNPNPIEWFRDETGVNNFYNCANTPGPNWMPFWDDEYVLCAYYNRIINDYGYNSKEYIRMVQTLLRYEYQRDIYALPKCVTNDPLLPDCWHELIAVERELIRLYTDRDVNSADLLQKVEELSAAYELGIDKDQLETKKNEVTTLASLVSNEDYSLDLQDITDRLEDIDCKDSIINVAIPILKEYIRYLQTDDKSSFDYSTLIGYSRYCADEYGPYIYLARGIVYLITDEYFDQNDDCTLRTPESRNLINDREEAYIYPNPSTGTITLTFGLRSSGTIEVSDLAGRRILKQQFDKINSVELNLSEYVGVNLITVRYLDGTVEVIKQITIE